MGIADGLQALRHGSLFSGIGGFDLAADWIGWVNVFHCESDSFCRQVLNYYYPTAQSYGDIKKTDFSSYRGAIDILTGGFPCQPYSTAGKRLGKEDPRHLWPDMLRAIQEIQPLWVVGENVRGLISWDGGLVFHEVQSDLEAEGYEVLPFLLPAAGVNAPHRRERIWFIAYRGGIGWNETRGNTEGAKKRETFRTYLFTQPERPGEKRAAPNTNGDGGPHQEYYCKELPEEEREFSYRRDHGVAADTDGSGFQKKGAQQQTAGFEQYGELGIPVANPDCCQRCQGWLYAVRPKTTERYPCICDPWNGRNAWQDFPAQSPLCHGNDGFSAGLDGITFPKWRSESIRAGGNAIVPQVALLIFKTIQELQIKLQMQRP